MRIRDASQIFASHRDLSLSQLTPTRRRLVLLMQELCFGTIHDLPVRSGQPVLASPLRVVRRKKLGGINHPRPQSGQADFALKREVVEFLNDLDVIDTGTILTIEVAHGLPILYEFEDVIRV